MTSQAVLKPVSAPAGVAEEARAILARLGVPASAFAAAGLPARSPITGETVAVLAETTPEAASAAIGRAHAAFLAWRPVPAPRRGEFVRLIGEELRAAKTGSRPPRHPRSGQDRLRGPRRGAGDDRHLRLRRRPLAPALRAHHRHRARRAPDDGDLASARCLRRHLRLQLPGRGVVLERRPRLRLRRQRRLEAVGEDAADGARGRGRREPCGEALRRRAGRPSRGADRRPRRSARRWSRTSGSPLVSATGSTAMGRQVGPKLAARFARAILELGGNNAAIVAPSADLDLALRAIAFSAMGTAGQRCTTPAPPLRARQRLRRPRAEARQGLRQRAHRRSARRGHAGRTAHRQGRLRRHGARPRRGPRRRRQSAWRRPRRGRKRGGLLCPPGPRRDAGADRAGAARNLRADPLRDALHRPR